MVRKFDALIAAPHLNGADQTPTAETGRSELSELLDHIGRLLQEGKPKKALDVLTRSSADSREAVNARGVCLLRLGEVRRAIELFRGLVLAPGGLVLRPDVPTTFKTNFATALLMDGNIAGCTSVLSDVREEEHPAVRKLRAAIRRWKEGMSFWEKVSWHLGSAPDRAVELGFDPGEL
jgi:hypothetical protein